MPAIEEGDRDRPSDASKRLSARYITVRLAFTFFNVSLGWPNPGQSTVDTCLSTAHMSAQMFGGQLVQYVLSRTACNAILVISIYIYHSLTFYLSKVFRVSNSRRNWQRAVGEGGALKIQGNLRKKNNK